MPDGKIEVHHEANVTVVSNPLVTNSLSTMRRVHTTDAEFRRALAVVAPHLYAAALTDVRMKTMAWDTPVVKGYPMQMINDQVLLVPVLRAGDGLLAPIHELIPEVSVGHIGLVRDPVTHMPSCYLNKLPRDTKNRFVIVLDPMVATGNSACDALDKVKEAGATRIRLMCLLTVPEGINRVYEKHPDVPIITAAIDSHLNEHMYIVPGLGDAGDRIFGTH